MVDDPRALLSLSMADDQQESEPTPKTQLTHPKGQDKHGNPAEPVEIPVPKVSTFRAAIRKVAQPVTSSEDRRRRN